MKTHLKKLLPLVGVVSCFSSSLLLAASHYGGSGNDACCPPKKPEPVCAEPCNEEVTRMKVFEECKYREITPDAGPRVACGTDFFITADFIYWATRMDGLGYAATNIAGVNVPQGSVSHPDFGWEPGFKVGLGYNLPHDGWDVFVEYTYLRPSADDSTTNNTNRMVRLWADPTNNPFETVSSARANWDFDLNVIDLELGRNFFVSRYLTLRPFFGLKGAWTSSSFTIRTVDALDSTLGDVVAMGQDFWGVGFRTGMNTVWWFNKYFGIFGDFALSALWGDFDVTRRDANTITVNNVVTETTTSNTKNCFSSMKPVFEIAMGLEGDYWFSDDQYHFGAKLGWEMQYWANQNQFFSLNEEGSHGDLSFMGLTLRFRFDF
ncbi:MAG: hypothetical protein H7A40_03815 [Chlamydiales bacterium]|nr:hypothetical protein [Chlamydiales bacterium]